MEMKNVKIDGTLMTVTSVEQYDENPELYVSGRTAVEVPEKDMVLPVYKRSEYNPGRIGLYHQSCTLFSKVVLPEEAGQYAQENVIDLSDAHTMADLISKQEAVRDIEYDMLTTVDNEFVPKIGENDSPAMRALKTAVTEKHIDINQYSHRFGSNFNNDRRQYNRPTISMQMLERQCRGFDIKATLILEDASPDVANPIGRKIVVELTEGGGESDED